MPRLTLLLAALVALAPATAGAGRTEVRREHTRPLDDGFLYAGTAPGLNFGGHSLPHTLYMDVLQAGYVLPSGIDLGFALSGMNFFPGSNEYSITMGRFAVGYRPFLRDPLPMIQPYAFAGTGFGGEGRYLCEPEPSCDPETDVCRDVCERANWVGTIFGGAGIDFNSHLLEVAGQQLLLYGGIQARYEWIPSRYRMPVVTFPLGLRLQ